MPTGYEGPELHVYEKEQHPCQIIKGIKLGYKQRKAVFVFCDWNIEATLKWGLDNKCNGSRMFKPKRPSAF